MTFIDAKGKPCPMPVILAKSALESGADALEIAVDNAVAVQNLSRFASDRGCSAETREAEGGFLVTLRRSGASAPVQTAPCPVCTDAGYAFFIGKDHIGEGDAVLGENLLKMALYTLSQGSQLPECIVFMNSGVRLPAGDDTQVIESLQTLAVRGVQIIVCGTCLNFYGLTGQLRVGKISNMYEILEKLQGAAKVITL